MLIMIKNFYKLLLVRDWSRRAFLRHNSKSIFTANAYQWSVTQVTCRNFAFTDKFSVCFLVHLILCLILLVADNIIMYVKLSF